jgi:hypothetical protein
MISPRLTVIAEFIENVWVPVLELEVEVFDTGFPDVENVRFVASLRVLLVIQV